MEPDDFEVDASVLFKQEASELTSVRDLEDALARFGYSRDDRITRRELSLMYDRIRAAMEEEIFRLANSNEYARAKEMRHRLTSIRAEFDHHQLSGVENLRASEQEKFQTATRAMTAHLRAKHVQEVRELNDFFAQERSNETLYHTIQTGNLEQTVSKIPRPKFRGSKRLAELTKAEYALNKSHAYDEAMKVHRMIDSILPKEEEKFYKNFDDSIEARRNHLRRLQKEDDARIQERLKGIKWDELRRRELESSIMQQRVKNHNKDMAHMHTMEKKLKPEMSVKPSALWQHREHYNGTAAALRGQQLLDYSRGKREGVAVYADTLVDKHDFDDMPLNTTLVYSSHERPDHY